MTGSSKSRVSLTIELLFDPIISSSTGKCDMAKKIANKVQKKIAKDVIRRRVKFHMVTEVYG